MKRSTVAACLISLAMLAGEALAQQSSGPYCPNQAGNMAPFCVDGCSAVSPCDKKCRAADAAESCITCQEWGECDPGPGDPGDPVDTMEHFSGQALVTRSGCEMTVPVRSEHIGARDFHIFLDKGPCDILDTGFLEDTRVAARATANGSWRIAIEEWGIILITPSSPDVRAAFAAAFPSRSVNQRNVTWINRDINVEILFQAID